MGRLSQVIENYELKLRLGAGGKLSESEINRRVGRYSMAAVQEDMVLNMTRQILCSHGVATMMFPAYHAFSRELGRLSREEISADTLQREMMVTAEKWMIRGLLREVLLDIALNIFNVEPPADPAE
jgi:hypothetical protein